MHGQSASVLCHVPSPQDGTVWPNPVCPKQRPDLVYTGVIAMPVQDGRPIRRQVLHGCMPTLLSETQGGPTQLFGRTRINLCAQGACHEFSPQAYPNSG